MDYRPALSADESGTRIRLRVVPRAAASEIGGLHGAAVKLRVAAPPVEGKANEAALALLADRLGVRARDLVLVTGGRARTKVVLVRGLGPDAVAARLDA